MNTPLTNASNPMLACVLTLVPVIANANTLERVQTGHSLILGYLPDFAPFSTQEGDKASGYAIDLCLKVVDKVKSELGLPSLQVRYQPLKVNEVVNAISAGKVDILCTPTQATLERPKTVNFSIPVYTAGLSVVVRKNAPNGLLKVLTRTQGSNWLPRAKPMLSSRNACCSSTASPISTGRGRLSSHTINI